VRVADGIHNRRPDLIRGTHLISSSVTRPPYFPIVYTSFGGTSPRRSIRLGSTRSYNRTAGWCLNIWHVRRLFEKLFAYAVGMQQGYMGISKEKKVPMFWFSSITGDGHPTQLLWDSGPSILGVAFGFIAQRGHIHFRLTLNSISSGPPASP
jgi:hypothetical protein